MLISLTGISTEDSEFALVDLVVVVVLLSLVSLVTLPLLAYRGDDANRLLVR